MKRLLLVIVLLFVISGIYITYRWVNNDSYSETAIGAIEKYIGENTVNYIIHEHKVADGKVIFYIQNINNDGSIIVSFGYVINNLKGWKWVYGGGHSSSGVFLDSPSYILIEPITYQFIGDLIDKEIGDSPFPMIYGVILNPDISRIVIKDYAEGLEKQASIINIRDDFKLYYIFTDSKQGQKFDIIAYDVNGKELYRTTEDSSVINTKKLNVNSE